MPETAVRALGLVLASLYLGVIVWLSASQPQTFAEVTGGLTAAVGAYRVDATARHDGLRFFRNDQFVEARAAFLRADPAERDPETQFYVAYAFYREGWGRLSHEDALYARGITAVDRAIGAAGGGRVVVDDPTLGMHSADELRAELQAGLTTDLSDVNPLRVLRQRK